MIDYQLMNHALRPVNKPTIIPGRPNILYPKAAKKPDTAILNFILLVCF